MQISHLNIMQAQLGWALSLFQALLVLGLGLVWLLAVWQWLIGTTKRPTDTAAYESLLDVFAVVARTGFGFGLLTLVLVAVSWSTLFERTGNVLGPLLLVVVSIAFLTKTTVFRVMVSDRERVSEVTYSFCTLGAAFGYSLVVAGLVVMDAWLRDPVGASLIDGRFQVLEIRPIFFNAQVGWQMLLTFLGATLATVGWVVGRQGLVALNAGAAAQSQRMPKSLIQGLCGFGFAAILITLVVLDLTVARLVLDHGSLTDLLSGNLLAEPSGLTGGAAMVATARAVMVMLLLYLLLIAVAWLYGDIANNKLGLRMRLTAGLMLLGPALWAGLWLLIYLSKGHEVVVGRLTVEDLAIVPSMTFLWVSASLLAIATVATVIALWRSTTESLMAPQAVSIDGALP